MSQKHKISEFYKIINRSMKAELFLYVASTVEHHISSEHDWPAKLLMRLPLLLKRYQFTTRVLLSNALWIDKNITVIGSVFYLLGLGN